MATTSGVTGGSQIDAKSLAQQLVNAERAPLDAQIARETSRITTQVSALGSLMGSMSSFRIALSSLKSTEAFDVRQATSSDSTKFTATANSTASAGSYSVEVEQLATAHQISSPLFASGATQVVGTGTLNISLGNSGFNVNIGSNNQTLAGIRDAINSASGNPGVRATLVKEGSGAHLVLSSVQTGSANVIAVTPSGGNGGLAQLAYSTNNQGGYEQLTAANNAIVRIAGYESTSSTNTVTNAVDGVTLKLLAADPGNTQTLTVSDDRAAIAGKVSSFVTAYNALQAQMKRLGGYDSATKVAGPMLGDSLLNSISAQIRNTLQKPVAGIGGDYTTLASIGITTQADGSLAVNDTKLQAALSADLGSVGKLFGSANGVATTLATQVEQRLQNSGALDTRSQNLQIQQRQLTQRQSSIENRMQSLMANYVRQFTALDNMLSSMQTTSSFLSQQIDSLANLNRSSSR
jgi:flagellar hook-associated protein 2